LTVVPTFARRARCGNNAPGCGARRAVSPGGCPARADGRKQQTGEEYAVRITKIETIQLKEHPQAIWVQVYTDGGIVGLGETWYAPSVVAAAIHDWFGPLLIGRDPFESERLWEQQFRLSDHAGYGGAEMRAISALDIALWDIKGQALGVPIYELLGGAVRKRVPVYATGMPYTGAAEVAKRLLDEGITAMKGGPTIPLALASDGQYLAPAELDRALRPFREIREAVGMEMQFANDAHAKWNLPIAIRIAQAMESLEPMWQEDLTPLLNPEALRRLQEATRTPICISERLLTRWQLRQYIENGSARIVMPDLIWTGGISETHKIAILASAHQVPFAPHDATGPVNIFAFACRDQDDPWTAADTTVVLAGEQAAGRDDTGSSRRRRRGGRAAPQRPVRSPGRARRGGAWCRH
jgi:L-alanine-DL-glutamate epimerase-like enolase superfamily enzyme